MPQINTIKTENIFLQTRIYKGRPSLGYSQLQVEHCACVHVCVCVCDAADRLQRHHQRPWRLSSLVSPGKGSISRNLGAMAASTHHDKQHNTNRHTHNNPAHIDTNCVKYYISKEKNSNFKREVESAVWGEGG